MGYLVDLTYIYVTMINCVFSFKCSINFISINLHKMNDHTKG
jgi:hypothetical protein